MTNRFGSFLIVVGLLGGQFVADVRGRRVRSQDSASIPSQALSQLLTSLPSDLPVYGIYVYPLFQGSTEIALLTTGEQEGWQIRVFGRGKTGQFATDWESAALPPEFAVSSAGNFRRVQVDYLHEGADIEFSGCKAHDCPGSFGVLLYSPSRKQAFQAVVRNGETVLSPELDQPANKPIKDYLLKRVNSMSHYHDHN